MFDIMSIVIILVATLVFAIVGPVVGCLLSGIDRKISAKMQGRVGPPLLQPYYDVRKLLEKERASVNDVESIYVWAALIFAIVSGGIFFGGGNILLCVFTISLASLFFIMAAYSTRSPYAEIGAHRETLQVLAYEPMVLFMAVMFYMLTLSFNTSMLFSLDAPMICKGFLTFIGLVFVLTIKLRKSPFDLSMSHHAHQEIVRGMTIEMSGPTLAKVEIMHWCETTLFMGWVAMFFVWSNPVSIILALVVLVAVYFLEIYIDNNFARVKWQAMLKWAWIVSGVCAAINMCLMMVL